MSGSVRELVKSSPIDDPRPAGRRGKRSAYHAFK